MSTSKFDVISGNSGRTPGEMLLIFAVAGLGALVGLYEAWMFNITFFGMPIRADSFLRAPTTDLSCVQQIGTSFLRGTLVVLHYTLWIGGNAVLGAVVTALLQGLRGPQVIGRARASRLPRGPAQ